MLHRTANHTDHTVIHRTITHITRGDEAQTILGVLSKPPRLPEGPSRGGRTTDRPSILPETAR
jgi:hypothetical protein